MPSELIIVDDEHRWCLQIVKAFLDNTPPSFNDVDINHRVSRKQTFVFCPKHWFPKKLQETLLALDMICTILSSFKSKINWQHNNISIFFIIGIQLLSSNIERPKISTLNYELTPVAKDAYLLEQPLKTITSHTFVMWYRKQCFCKKEMDEFNPSYVENASFNEANDFWYRVLKVVLSNEYHTGCSSHGNYICWLEKFKGVYHV